MSKSFIPSLLPRPGLSRPSLLGLDTGRLDAHQLLPQLLALQRHFFSPLSLGASDARDTPGDCAVGPRPRRRGSPQSYTYAGVTRLRITGGAATPSALALFFPK